jgi:hypothetical protein
VEKSDYLRKNSIIAEKSDYLRKNLNIDYYTKIPIIVENIRLFKKKTRLFRKNRGKNPIIVEKKSDY